jgi:hypothetical protein
MSLSDLASIGSFVSARVTTTAAPLLLVQTRQTIRNQRALMQQGRSARSAELLMRLSEPRPSDIIVRAEAGDLTLTPSEAQSYFRLCAAFFSNYEDSFLQFRAGTMDRRSWEPDLATLKQFASSPANRVAWSFARGFWDGEYRDFVDALMRETPSHLPPDYAAFWKSRMTEELALSGGEVGGPAP